MTILFTWIKQNTAITTAVVPAAVNLALFPLSYMYILILLLLLISFYLYTSFAIPPCLYIKSLILFVERFVYPLLELSLPWWLDHTTLLALTSFPPPSRCIFVSPEPQCTCPFQLIHATAQLVIHSNSIGMSDNAEWHDGVLRRGSLARRAGKWRLGNKVGIPWILHSWDSIW
jgi:hypothetical protein